MCARQSAEDRMERLFADLSSALENVSSKAKDSTHIDMSGGSHSLGHVSSEQNIIASQSETSSVLEKSQRISRKDEYRPQNRGAESLRKQAVAAASSSPSNPLPGKKTHNRSSSVGRRACENHVKEVQPQAADVAPSTSLASASTHAGIDAPAPLLSRFRSQLASIRDQWLAARREAKLGVWATISLSSTQDRNGNESIDQSTFIRRTIEGKGPAEGFHSAGNYNAGTASSSAAGGRRRGGGPTQLLLHKVLGVQLPLSAKDNGSTWLGSTDNAGGFDTDIALDLSRVHELQRAIVDYSSAAVSMSSAIAEGIGIEACGWPTSFFTVKISQDLATLRQRSAKLLLLTACMAPLAPLTTIDRSLSSSCTGLEALEAQVHRYSVFPFENTLLYSDVLLPITR